MKKFLFCALTLFVIGCTPTRMTTEKSAGLNLKLEKVLVVVKARTDKEAEEWKYYLKRNFLTKGVWTEFYFYKSANPNSDSEIRRIRSTFHPNAYMEINHPHFSKKQHYTIAINPINQPELKWQAQLMAGDIQNGQAINQLCIKMMDQLAKDGLL